MRNKGKKQKKQKPKAKQHTVRMKLLRALKSKQTTRRNSSSSKLIREPYVPIHLRHSHFECLDKSCQLCYSNKIHISGDYLGHKPSDYSQLPTRRHHRRKSNDEDGSRSNSRCGNRYIRNIDDLLRNEKFANAAGYGVVPSSAERERVGWKFSPPSSASSKKRKRVSWQ